MATASFLNDLMHTLGDRGRALIGRSRDAIMHGDLVALGELLLSRRGEASGVALARTLLDTYVTAPLASRLSFLNIPIFLPPFWFAFLIFAGISSGSARNISLAVRPSITGLSWWRSLPSSRP